MIRGIFRKSGRFAILMAAFMYAPEAACADPDPENPWRDAGANAFNRGRASVSAGTAVSIGGWRDAGASAAVEESALAGARWEAWKSGALMSAEWRSEKLLDTAAAPFNTWLLVFNRGENGIDSVTEYVRGKKPQRELARYLFMRGKDRILVSRQQAGADDFAVHIATLDRSGEAWIVRTPSSEDSYRRSPDGGLTIDRILYGGRQSERYQPDGRAVFTKADLVTRRGAFESKPEFGVAQWSEIPTGAADDMDYAYWFDSVKNENLSFSIGNAEPLADARFAGLSDLLTGPLSLENLVIADVVFGSYRRATPVLAWAFLGKMPQRSAN